MGERVVSLEGLGKVVVRESGGLVLEGWFKRGYLDAPTYSLYTSTTTSGTMCSMTTSNKYRLTLFINPDIIKHAKAEAIVEGLSLTALVERALVKYLPKETVIRKVEIREGVR